MLTKNFETKEILYKKKYVFLDIKFEICKHKIKYVVYETKVEIWNQKNILFNLFHKSEKCTERYCISF